MVALARRGGTGTASSPPSDVEPSVSNFASTDWCSESDGTNCSMRGEVHYSPPYIADSSSLPPSPFGLPWKKWSNSRESLLWRENWRNYGTSTFYARTNFVKLREADVLVERGSTAVDARRQIRISEQTLYQWRKEHGGLKVDQARRMEDLERENARLKRLVADLALDKAILQEASKLAF